MSSHFDLKNVRIEAATARDAARLLSFIRAYYRFDRIPFDAKAIAAGLSLLLDDPTLGRAWLILNRRRPVGYLLLTFGFDLEFGGRQATITDFYIDPGHRRKGVGRKVLMHVETFCQACGVKALELQETSKNARALEFYKFLGFGAHERIPMSKHIACQSCRRRTQLRHTQNRRSPS